MKNERSITVIARLIKSMAITIIVIIMLNIIGCSPATSSKSTEANHKAKITEVKKEKKAPPAAKDQQNQNQQNTATNQDATTAGSANKSTQNISSSSTNITSGQTKAINDSSQATSSKTATSANSSAIPNQQTASSTQPAPTTPQPPVQSVKLTIAGPKDQTDINRDLKVTIKDGYTVLDVLLNGIGEKNVNYSGSGAFAYVKGILGVSQFDYGPKSGWTVSQNGTRLTRSAGAIQVKANDNIEWKYTEDYTVNN